MNNNMNDITIYVTTDATADEYTAAVMIADGAGVDCERGDHTYIEGGDAIEMSQLFAVLNSEMAIARGETD